MIGEFGGRIIDIAGDEILAEFASVVKAMECAVGIQFIMADRNRDVDRDRRMQFRIGGNIGDVIYDESRIFGDGINIAARLENIAEPGGICISSKVYEEVRGRSDVAFQNIGEQKLKIIALPVVTYRVKIPARHDAAGELVPTKIGLPETEKPSIIVLPFVVAEDCPEDQRIADDMAKNIVQALSKVRWILVISSNSGIAEAKTYGNLKRAGRDLGAGYALEGDLRRSANRVQVRAKLVHAPSDSEIWTNRYDRDLADLDALHDEITRQVIAVVETELGAPKGDPPPVPHHPPGTLPAIKGDPLRPQTIRADNVLNKSCRPNCSRFSISL